MKQKSFFSFAMILLLTITSFAQTGWQQLNAGVSANLNSVFFLDANNGFVVGESGTFLKTNDGGLSWTASTTTPAANLNAVYFFNLNEGLIAANNGLILRTVDGGATWNTVATGVSDDLLSLSFSGSIGICGGLSQTILRTADSGASWIVAVSGFFGGGYYGAHMLDANTGYLAGENTIFQSIVGKTTDGGANWDYSAFYINGAEARLYDLYFFDANNGVTAAAVWDATGAVSRTTNGGGSWTSNIFGQAFFGMHFSGSSGYVVGLNGVIYKSTDSGLSWVSQNSGTNFSLYDVFLTGEFTAYAVGDNGLILKNSNNVPVELTSFTYMLTGALLKLKWETASEINNYGFEVERALDINQWQQIGFVKGNGTITEKQIYTFIDDLNNVNISGKIYYRLKQTDYDGTFEYSDVIEVDYNPNPVSYSLHQNYPNPFNPVTKIRFSIPNSSHVSIKVYDINGKEVITLVDEFKPQGIYEITLDATGLSSGVYIYKMNAGDFYDAKSFILLK